MGLDEKAVEAVSRYQFKPATLRGTPVPVDLYVDVNFQIL
jgi:protein TonB